MTRGGCDSTSVLGMIADIKMSSTQKPSCFVIAPIGAKDTEIRKRFDKVLKHIFRNALIDKFEVTRVNEGRRW
jgi:hydroxymethylpyrimidine/phosphomethylpyrimidine kinase